LASVSFTILLISSYFYNSLILLLLFSLPVSTLSSPREMIYNSLLLSSNSLCELLLLDVREKEFTVATTFPPLDLHVRWA